MLPEYVQERLESLNEIDLKLCSLLQETSQIVNSYSELKRGNSTVKPQFEEHLKEFYLNLDVATTNLRKEIQLLDENIGTRLLPINVNKKALGQDTDVLVEQISLLKDILNDKKED
ncbi:hypothetical protein Kpol_1018p155 [Vanderwaltozyma polyspora DSM 70294]|uniref:Mediator of RNA polymerase II transcription subunit 11 n=1 Tax=Vanderwaltozyma polyspora (strain ATCC 22028 / DSM 70294 / BCRC 21397 / CBS 2163 / NBRC 10782 / NRRL Y-8283 / UCD 57-17) TaxID=436907 RepID=A7TDZ6_VANPO|nr:uncharacterized protein Kpol_1018p155 [Vanderwaltozyma polyspora DSM 70294]EDO19616.1 hypothetical protein Kpol_1018p155 [Vanderwaltozyma polyspora DSM 70294]